MPFGIALSGGIDSSAIACCVRYLNPNIEINTFSYVPKGKTFSEEYWIDLVNKKINAKSHKISFTKNDLENDISNLINLQGEPFTSPHVCTIYCFPRSKKKRYKSYFRRARR